MAKLPKFGDPGDETAAQAAGGFKLPKFTNQAAIPAAPKVATPKTVARQIASTKLSPIQAIQAEKKRSSLPIKPKDNLTKLQETRTGLSVGEAVGAVADTWYKGTQKSPLMRPIVSAASAVFNTIMAPLNWQRGYQYAQAVENNEGFITEDDIRDAAFWNRKINGQEVEIIGYENGRPQYNIQPTVTDREEVARANKRRQDYGYDNMGAWLKGVPTIYGEDVKAEYGLDTTPGFAGISEAGRVGFLEDLVLDPINAIPFGKLGSLAKATSAMGKGVVDSAKLMRRGEISQALADVMGVNTAAATRVTSAPLDIDYKFQQMGGNAAKATEEAKRALDAFAYKSSVVLEPLAPSAAMASVVGSGVEAGYKALRQSLIRSNLDDFLKAYAKRDITRKGFVRTQIVKGSDDVYRVLSGNGEELGRARTKTEARALAQKIKYGESASGLAMKTVDDLIRAEQSLEKKTVLSAEKQNAETASLPEEAGENITIEQFEPFEGSDGKWYVYDGESIARAPNLEAAEDYIAAKLYQETELAAPVVTKEKSGYSVRLGDEVFKTKTKAEADALAKAYSEQTLPASVAAKRGAPLVDKSPDQAPLADVLKIPATTEEGKVLQQVLKTLDKEAKAAKGVRAVNSQQMKERVQDIIRGGASKEVAQEDAILKNLTKEVLDDLEDAIGPKTEVNPFSFYEFTLNGNPAKAIFASQRVVSQGKYLGNYNTIVTKGGVWKAGSPDAATKLALEDMLSTMRDRIAGARAGTGFSADSKYAKIKAEFGEEFADKIRATGILEPYPNTAAGKEALRPVLKAYNAIIDKELTKLAEVEFTGVEDLIQKAKSGVTIDETAIEKIFKVLDPDNNIISKVEAANAEGVPSQLFYNELLRGEGVQTIRDIQTKLAHFGDVTNLIKASKISDDLLLAQMIKDLRSPEGGELTEFVTEAASKQSKQVMAARLASADPQIRSRALEGVAEANAETFAKIQAIEASPGAQMETLDTFGRVVSRSTEEAYMEGSEAVANRVFNQVRQRKMLNVIAGTTRAAITRGSKALDRGRLLDETIESFKAADDALGLLDIRMTVTKNRADEDFVGAFEKAKAAKKKFNFAEDGHFVYLNTGDVLETISKTGPDARNLVIDSFFPPTMPNRKPSPNYLSNDGFLDAARQALEFRSKGKPIDVDNLTARILNGGINASRYTKTFADKYQPLARSLAEYLAREDVLETLSKVHLEKSIGIAERWMRQAESVHDDLQRLLYDSWLTNQADGNLGDITRVEMLRNYLRKVAYVADVFKIEGGAIAESTIKSISAMMLKRGLINTPDSADDLTKLIDEEFAQSMRKVINTMYLYEKPQFAMKPGQTKFVSDAQKAKISNKLEEVQKNYEDVMARVDDQYSTNPAVRQQFYKDSGAVQAKLDRARQAAVEAGLPTWHYSGRAATAGRNPWVRSDKYKYETEVRTAQQRLLNYEAARAGLRAREDIIADSRPVMPKVTLLKGKRRDEFLKKERAQIVDNNIELAKSRIRNAEDETMELMENAHFERMGVEPDAAALLYTQHAMAKGMAANTGFHIELPNPQVYAGVTKYSKEGRLVEEISRGERLSERGYGLSKGRRDVSGIMRSGEAKMHKFQDSYANLLGGIYVRLRNAPDELIEEAFNLIKQGEMPSPAASPQLIEAYGLMNRAWAFVTDSVENAITTLRGVDGDMLAKAMENSGLTPENGFPSPRGLSSSELPEFYQKLPFGEAPVISHMQTDAQRIADSAFRDNRELALKSGAKPLLSMLRLMQATQNVIFRKGLAEEFAARFSYRAEGLTYEQALKQGYVEPKAVGAESSLLRYLPEPKNGGLFPRDMAKQFFSMEREIYALMDSKVAEKLRTETAQNLFTAVGALKSSQTVLIPRHFWTNFLGDSSTAMIRGTLNPRTWGSAARLAGKFAWRRADATYFAARRVERNPEVLERLFEEAMRRGQSVSKAGRFLEGTDAAGKRAAGLVVYRNGKPTRINISDEDLINLFEDYGIIEESIYQQDIVGLVDNLDRDGLPGGRLETGKRLSAHGREALRRVTKVPGDLVANSGNIPRIAHALELLNRRTWSSVDQAMDAVSREIALFHPTAKSLTAAERQFGRFATTYYTWMRMAQVGMLRMVAENTREISAIQKTLYEWNREQMGDDNRPINVGTGFGGDPNLAPAYLSSTAGVGRISGRTLQNIVGPLGIVVPDALLDKELQFIYPLMYNDALNYWKADFEPYRDPEGEIISSVLGGAGSGMNPGIAGVLGKNISLIGEPVVGLLYNRDPATGRRLDFKTFNDVFEYTVAKNTGFGSPIKALGLDPNATEEERFIAGISSLVGLQIRDVQTEANAQNALNQANARTKEFADQILKQDAPARGTWLRDRVTSILEKEKEAKAAGEVERKLDIVDFENMLRRGLGLPLKIND